MKTIGLDWDLALKKSLTLSKGKTENEQDAGLLMLIALHTGLRKGDLLNLKKEQFQNGLLIGKAEKTDKEYSFPIPDWLTEKVMNHSKRTDTILFQCRSHIFLNRWIDRTFPIEKAKAEKNGHTISCHSFRKAFGMKVYNHYGVNVARESLQHSDIAMTTRYLNIDKTELETQLKSLWD